MARGKTYELEDKLNVTSDILGGSSYREASDKYGMPFTTIEGIVSKHKRDVFSGFLKEPKQIPHLLKKARVLYKKCRKGNIAAVKDLPDGFEYVAGVE